MSTLRNVSTLTVRQKTLEQIAAQCKHTDRPRALKAMQAIRRIKDGEYGYCMSCGMRIPERDTEWKPERTLCSNCESHARTIEDMSSSFSYM